MKGRLMKRYLFYLVLTSLCLSLLLTSCNSFDNPPNDIEMPREEEKNKGQTSNELITVLQGFTNEEIIGFYDDDYDRDGTLEAYAVTANRKIPEETRHSNGLSFWFIKKDKSELLLSGDLSVKPVFFEYTDKILVSMDSYVGEKCESSVYFVSKNHAHSYGSFGGKLVRSSQESETFFLYKNETDVILNTADNSLSGESRKPYYLHFDGNFFTEYGGKAMREDQLRALDGADALLTSISEGGYRIDSIYRRENGIINVNVSRNNGNGTVIRENVTLIIIGGTVRLVPVGKNDNPMFLVNNSTLITEIVSNKFSEPAKFSYHGSYKAASLPDIAVYPVEAENKEAQ